MCGLINDTIDFVTSGVKELASHPFQTLGTALLGPALATGLDAAGIGFGSLISPVGNFSNSAWGDMFNANPGNAGLGLFHSINDVADKVAPAVAGGFAGGAGSGLEGLSSALSSTGTDAAAGLGGSAFTTGLEGAADTLGGLESGLGGAGLFGTAAGTGTALGSAAAQGLGAEGLGVAGGGALSSLGSGAGTYAAGLGSTLGQGVGQGTGTASGASTAGGAVPTSAGSFSTEGSQAAAAPGAFENGASVMAQPGSQLGPMGFDQAQAAGAVGPQDGTNLSTLYGPSSAAPSQPAAMFSGMNTTGISPAMTSSAATGNMDPSTFQTLGDLFKLANTGVNAFQQYRQQSANNNYADSIKNLFAPNSPYAQQMQQTLARQDAAAGRNSQYGTRSVQLAAALAQAQANALGNSNYARAATATPGMNALNGLFANFGSPQGMQSLYRLGQGAYNLGSAGFNGLASLFG